MPMLVRRILICALSLVLCALTTPPKVQAAAYKQQGANMVPRWSEDYASPSFKQSIRNLAATGANSVSLIVPYYQLNDYSTDVNPGWNTPTDSSLASGVQTAQNNGLQVTLTLHDDPYSGDWRANINPDDRHGWFLSYGAFVNRYADFAQSHGVSGLVIGTELYHMTSANVRSDNTARWQSLISNVRSRYAGTLTYSANWGDPYDEKDQIAFWGSLDEIGISAYFSLASQTKNPTVDQLIASWDSWNTREITPLANRFTKPILFTEIGYESANDSHYAPGIYGRSGLNLTEQSNNYQATLSFWSGKNNFNGLYFWDWSSDPNAGGQYDTSFTPQHKPAEQLMRQYFSNIVSMPVPVTAPASLQLWWPVDGAQISGAQPFKAVVTGRDLGSYTMYWQVDGGHLNAMSDMVSIPTHKESVVDVSCWFWQGNSQYRLTFVAKDVSGATISSVQAMVHILH